MTTLVRTLRVGAGIYGIQVMHSGGIVANVTIDKVF